MRNKKYLVSGIAITMSLLLGGCAAKTLPTSTDSTSKEADLSTEAAATAAPTQETNSTECDVTQTVTSKETESEIIDETQDAMEEEAMTSGTLEDFEKYFALDEKTYFVQSEEAGTVESITYHSEVLSADREACVYLPYNYNPDHTYPVMYLIHGIGCDSGQWVSMGVAKAFDTMIANGDIAPFIAVFPSVIPVEGIDPNTLSDTNIQAFKDFVEEYDKDLRPYMVEKYNISTNRMQTAICGLSMGGMEALRLGFTYLDQFAYIGSFSAAPTLEMELLTTEGSEFIPELVLVCSGDKDNTVGDNPLNYHKELTKNQVKHIWYQHPNGSHSPNVWKLGLLNFVTRIPW